MPCTWVKCLKDDYSYIQQENMNRTMYTLASCGIITWQEEEQHLYLKSVSRVCPVFISCEYTKTNHQSLMVSFLCIDNDGCPLPCFFFFADSKHRDYVKMLRFDCVQIVGDDASQRRKFNWCVWNSMHVYARGIPKKSREITTCCFVTFLYLKFAHHCFNFIFVGYKKFAHVLCEAKLWKQGNRRCPHLRKHMCAQIQMPDDHMAYICYGKHRPSCLRRSSRRSSCRRSSLHPSPWSHMQMCLRLVLSFKKLQNSPHFWPHWPHWPHHFSGITKFPDSIHTLQILCTVHKRSSVSRSLTPGLFGMNFHPGMALTGHFSPLCQKYRCPRF